MNKEKVLRNKIEKYLLVPILFSLILVAMCVGIYFIDINAFIVAATATGIFIVCEGVVFLITQKRIMPVMMGFAMEQGQIQRELLKKLAVPYAVLDDDGKILWGNDEFVNLVGDGSRKRIRKNISAFFPVIGTDTLPKEEPVSLRLTLNGSIFDSLIKKVSFDEVLASDEDADISPRGEHLFAFYLFDVTELNMYKREIEENKLVAGLLYIDNYEEVMENTEEMRHSLVEALVDRRISMYFSTIDAIGKKTEKDKYLFVFRQKYLNQLKDTKFAILDEVKSINVGNEIPITLSIGIGADAADFSTAYENARTAIGLALGRGGDQAVIRYGDKISYFGGKSSGTEKSTRVKARVKAQAFSELLTDKENVLIMGHKRPDADAFGSAVGVYRLVKTLGKNANIVLDEATAAIENIVSTFRDNAMYGGEMIISREQAIASVNDKTLVVVVDVNKPSMTECEELLSLGKTVVVFDHHRQAEERIENATLSYIEPYASSACEMVAEMLQYIDEKVKIKPAEADAMYAGIVIDTNGFLTKTGVRTFEAASYLRRNGADVVRVRKMFREDMNSFKAVAEGVMNAEIFMTAFALSKVNPDSQAPTVLGAKVANELLDVEGIRASFVATKVADTVYLSARSVDDVNVQVIMEKIGGGGHANVAGAQIKDATVDEVLTSVKDLLKEMYHDGDL
ncbi:MAG: DHH family phosphoesterase [Lachnospiraceae bacterium]|nr:DHH family phosphoesterase [Lachnospiraceae bacterium]